MSSKKKEVVKMDLRGYKNRSIADSIKKGIDALREGIGVIGNVNRARESIESLDRARDFGGKLNRIDDALRNTERAVERGERMMRKTEELFREEDYSPGM